jgi:plasmid segregation protein ParM
MNNINVGIDIGYGYTKVVAGNNASIFPSVVGNFEEGIQAEGLQSQKLETIKIDNVQLLIGESALKHSDRFFSIRDKNWITSLAFRALLNYSFKLANLNGSSLVLVSGLPVSYYRTDKEVMERELKEVANTNSMANTIRVIPQPLGSFYDIVLDDNGRIKNDKYTTSKVGVLDIGFYTTDLLTIDNLELLKKQVTSFENGISSAYEKISKDIIDKYELNLSIHETEKSVRNGYIKVFGERKDISEIADKRLKELAIEIEAKVKTVWKNAADIDTIILSGGGASALKGFLNLYKHSVLINNSQFANARGYYKYSKKVGY